MLGEWDDRFEIDSRLRKERKKGKEEEEKNKNIDGCNSSKLKERDV